ncbi:hypothetical protein WMF45_33515 [Sorangium sp. So ce448]|uniref:PEGA domain-containing protein n=1 Tax=Sorangium sp. So ce448 TaxID=3133314 RepID=UPI003F616BEA
MYPQLAIEAVAQSDVGRRRSHNEDSFAALPCLGLFMVADGLGGNAAGEVASRMAIEVVKSCFDVDEDLEETWPDGTPEVKSSVMRRSSILVLCSALAAPISWSPSALAADTPADVSARQRALFDKGVRLYDQSRWAEARAVFLEAWALKKSYAVATNLGDVELIVGDARSAAVHLAYALRELPADEAPALRTLLTKRLAEARQLVGTLRVWVTPPEAELLVDGKPLLEEEAAYEIYLEPGTHRLAARRAGYAEAEQVVTVAAGGSHEAALALAELPAATPASNAPTPPHATPARQVKVEPGALRSWVPVIALGAASVVGLGVGAGMTVASNAASANVDRQMREILGEGGQCAKPTDAFVARCSEIRRTGTRADALGNAARVAYIAAGALAVATVGYVLWPSSKPSQSAHVGAWLDVRSDGLGVGAVGVW